MKVVQRSQTSSSFFPIRDSGHPDYIANIWCMTLDDLTCLGGTVQIFAIVLLHGVGNALRFGLSSIVSHLR